MKSIDTLVEDIYEVLDKGVISNGGYGNFGREMADLLTRRLAVEEVERTAHLRLSNVGTPCARQLWYKVNTPDDGEPLLPHTRLKFLYGDILECLLLELAKLAGHTVEGEQDTVSINGVVGHRDCVIDGMLVDVKSASDYSFKKFEGHLERDDDAFGYLTQLGSYLLAAREPVIEPDLNIPPSFGDPIVKDYDRAAFLVINKVTGKLCLDVHEFSEEDLAHISSTIIGRVREVNDLVTPDRGFEPVLEGKSGNEKLGVNCSYCAFKDKCWPDLRTFLYSNGPMFLTKVERLPQVYEVTK